MSFQSIVSSPGKASPFLQFSSQTLRGSSPFVYVALLFDPMQSSFAMAKQQWNHLQTTSCRRAHQTHTTCLPVLDKCLVCRLPWMGRGRSTALWPQSSAFSLIDSSNFRIYWIWTFYARCPPLRWVTIFWKRGTSKTPDRQLIALFLITGFTKKIEKLFQHESTRPYFWLTMSFTNIFSRLYKSQRFALFEYLIRFVNLLWMWVS